MTGSNATTVWADADRLHALGYRPWTSFPLWVPRSHPSFGFFGAGCTRARRHGLATRTLRATLAASLAVAPPAGEDLPVWAPDRSERARLATAVTSA